MNEAKREWQRKDRAAFKASHGYSMTAHYGAGRLREDVLVRDRHACVQCGMTDAEHKAKWDRPITIDHKDRNRDNNTMENLQTLCLACHGRKDQLPRLRAVKMEVHRSLIESRRAAGVTYQQIADEIQVSIASVWKWDKRWRTA